MSQITCTIDGVSFSLKEAHDFSFLETCGRVFKVFDDQDSGNICFGTLRGEERFFVKYAGARTMRACVTPEQAVINLQKTVPLYHELKHDNLIELLETLELPGGFAMIFRWTEAQCMGRMYPESHRRFMQMDFAARKRVFADIQQFMAHVHSKGFVAIDFYDGNIMYDFSTGQTLVCDIDFFRRKPCINDMGRMWGSSRFQAPEEYQLGAPIDERTNVYTLGATAFALFSNYKRELPDWPLGSTTYAVITKATNPDPNKRQQTIRQFMAEWSDAL